jgi:type II secretory pathway component PulF
LALFLHAGIPITQALALIQEDTYSKQATYILSVIAEDIAHGSPLSESLRRFEKIFGKLATQLIAVGETTGTLSQNLERLAHTTEKQQALARKVLSALIYPTVIVLGTICIALFLTLYAFPKLMPIFRGFHTKLPLTTRILIGIHDILVQDWMYLIVGIVFLTASFTWAVRHPQGRTLMHRAALRLPIIASFVRTYQLARISRILAVLLESGVRILPSLEMARSAVILVPYQQAFVSVDICVANGDRLSGSFRAFPTLFPSLFLQLVAAGELTGTLAESFATLAGIYEAEIDERAQNLTVLIEPLLMITMGLVVGFVALAIITPIYSLTQNLTVQ